MSAKGDKYSRRKEDGEGAEDFYARPGQKISFIRPNQSSVEPDLHTGRYVRRSREDGKFLNVDDGNSMWRVHPNNVKKVED